MNSSGVSVGDSATFQLIYDIRQAFPAELRIAVIPVLFLLLGIVLYRIADRFETSRVGFIGLACMIVGGLATLYFVAEILIPTVGLRIHLARGEYRVLEGRVRSFVPGDPGDHHAESWSLVTSAGTYQYSYNPAVVGGGGYAQTAPHGGQIREGARVRVTDVGGRIARLEIAR